VSAYRGLEGNEISAYWVGCLCGVISSAAVPIPVWIQSRRLGPRHVSLATPVDWWGFGLILATYAGVFLLFLGPMLASISSDGDRTYVWGLTFPLSSCATVSAFATIRPRLDLRENGIAIGLLSTALWSEVRVAQSNRNDTGRLEIVYRYRRVKAYVPSELRDEVDELLRERVPATPNQALEKYLDSRDATHRRRDDD
jgi:hypothetical protein